MNWDRKNKCIENEKFVFYRLIFMLYIQSYILLYGAEFWESIKNSNLTLYEFLMTLKIYNFPMTKLSSESFVSAR